MEDEAIADEIIAATKALLQAAGPEWTLQFINAGIEQAGAGGGEEPMAAETKAPGAGSFMTGLAGNA
jgi:hypothetical protein